MADVQSPAEKETDAHSLQKRYGSYASYSTAGLIEQGMTKQRPQELSGNKEVVRQEPKNSLTISMKRKAIDDSNDNDTQKRIRISTSPPEKVSIHENSPTSDVLMQSPAIAHDTPKAILDPNVDEDEWAAFEADIAATERLESKANIVISAPALNAKQIINKSLEEEYTSKREKEEAELTLDKEDAAQKMEEELHKMQILEEKVKRLRTKREELRQKSSAMNLQKQPLPMVSASPPNKENSDYSDEDENDESWDSFRFNE
ncbi:putative coiled-coil domain-containing protein 16 [Erysiphe neolycopersici]|uniref:Putative coiled-coil domain-containing protein 16 n=1 Tax=Erysiphe neolycopersici TaxID=212602 RepID=A0A420HS35_9PEZI|nr:putative coiled-coil domain-containing protein 16 [Erysiphe neolycopersici]